MELNKILKDYTDPSVPGSFSGLSGFLKNTNYKKEEASEILGGEEVYSLHHPQKHKFPRKKVIANGIDDCWQADLVDVSKLMYQNSHFKYILTVIDVFSKYAWAIPIKNKTAESTEKAFQQILSEGRKPRYIYVDGGNEFKGSCKKLLDSFDIKLVLTKSKFKASVVERFNRTLKEKMWRVFTLNNDKKYTEVLPYLLQAYNSSYHRSIKTSPNKVNKSNQEKIFENLYGYSRKDGNHEVINLKFKIGDYVRINVIKDLFAKGYTANWSKEVYIVREILLQSPPTYKIKTLDNEDIESVFYTQELQKVTYKEFPYDTYQIIQESGKKILAKKINDDDSTAFWTTKKELYG